ncbi:hypothetical protein HDU97_000094 [Phlyctochytrium planicorne]|nr:hypothetical protein HDU97_000094 [Phlyctochytrium planicorne]
MADASVILGWPNTAGSTLVAPFQTFQYGINSVSASASKWTKQEVNLTASGIIQIPSWAKISFSVVYGDKVGAGKVKESPEKTGYIVAWSSRSPSNKDSASTTGFSQHTSNPAIFTADLTVMMGTNTTGMDSITIDEGGKPFLDFGVLKSDAYVNYVHGVLMFIAWGVAPFAGIFVARYLKDRLGIWWFRLHVFLMAGVCGGLTIAGFLIKLLTKTPPHFKSPHEIIGLTIIVSLFVQSILGVVSDRLWSPDRPDVPWWDKLHWWFGRLSFLLALANLFVGLDRYNYITSPSTEDGGVGKASQAIFIVLGIWIFINFAGMVAGQFIFGQVHHVKGHGGGGVDAENKKVEPAES